MVPGLPIQAYFPWAGRVLFPVMGPCCFPALEAFSSCAPMGLGMERRLLLSFEVPAMCQACHVRHHTCSSTMPRSGYDSHVTEEEVKARLT